MSKAAGLFVDPPKGPVLLNYGIDECRFTKPVYPGMTLEYVLQQKKKLNKKREMKDDIAKGIVKFLVDVYDEEGDTVMLATILTMVKKLINHKNIKMKEYVKLKIENNIGTIEFYHPQSKFTTGNILSELAYTIKSAGENNDINVIVLKSGGERAFFVQELLLMN